VAGAAKVAGGHPLTYHWHCASSETSRDLRLGLRLLSEGSLSIQPSPQVLLIISRRCDQAIPRVAYRELVPAFSQLEQDISIVALHVQRLLYGSKRYSGLFGNSQE
jgi:hypothetical protein